jgi:hypothetical protein
VAKHSDALFKALAKGGIRLSREVEKWRSVGVPLPAPAIKPHLNPRPRTDGLLRWLSRNATADNLFNAACLLAELGLTQATTTRLVSGNLPSLRRALGDVEFTYQITRAYTHIAAKGAQPAPTPKGHFTMKNGNVVNLSNTDREVARIKAKLNADLTPRMRKWAIALEMLEKGYWPQDPEYTLLDGALEVVLAIRSDCISANWMSLLLLPEAEREKELDRMAQNPVLREWFTLYKKNIARAEEHKRKWAERKATAS